MWQVDVVCSEPTCAEEFEMFVEDLEEADLAVCACEYSAFTIAVSEWEPLRFREGRESSVKNDAAGQRLRA